MPTKTIFAIPGSLRQGSSNHNILKHLCRLAPSDINFIIYDNLAQIPPFDPGQDTDPAPESVTALRAQLAFAEAIIICTPEYAFGVPGQLKNALDWLVSSSSLADKPVALITASSSGEYAHPSLLRTLGALSAQVIDEACLLIPFIRSKMDSEGNVIDEGLRVDLGKALEVLLTKI